MSGVPQPTRRTLVKGAMWSVPVVAVAAPAPAIAASPGCVTLTPGVCRVRPQNESTYTYYVDFTNNCADEAQIVASVTVNVPGLTPAERSVSSTITVSPNSTGRISGAYTRCCANDFVFPNRMTVSYSVDGIPATTVTYTQTTWDCSAPAQVTLQRDVQGGAADGDARDLSEKSDASVVTNEAAATTDQATSTASPDQ